MAVFFFLFLLFSFRFDLRVCVCVCVCSCNIGNFGKLRDCKTWLHGSYATLSNCLRGAGRSIATTHKEKDKGANVRIPEARGANFVCPDSYESKSRQRRSNPPVCSLGIPQQGLMNNESSFLNLGFRRQLWRKKIPTPQLLQQSLNNFIHQYANIRNERRRFRYDTHNRSVSLSPPPPHRHPGTRIISDKCGQLTR